MTHPNFWAYVQSFKDEVAEFGDKRIDELRTVAASPHAPDLVRDAAKHVVDEIDRVDNNRGQEWERKRSWAALAIATGALIVSLIALLN